MIKVSFIQKKLDITYYPDQILSYLAAYDALERIAQFRRYLKLLISGIFLRFDLVVASLLVSHSELPQGNLGKNEKA